MLRQETAAESHADARIAVIGGGISGLAAAHRVRELNPQARVLLIESSDRLGGVIRTEQRDGFLVEHGPDNFITTPSWATDLCRRIGFDSELIGTNSTHRRAFVVSKGKLRPIPAGFAVMAPSRIWPILSTPILSPFGKLRMAAERFVRRSTYVADESLANFVRRRFGREVYERLVQPLIAGIYTGDPERLSVAATMPRFQQMEQEHGSLIRAMWSQRQTQKTATHQSSGARYSQFVAPRAGMFALVQAIANQLTNVEIHLQSTVHQLSQLEHGGWRLSVDGELNQDIEVDGVIVATPARASSMLLSSVDATLSEDFGKIVYGSCALVSLGFNREQITHPLDGFGVVVPAVENRRILSVSFSSVKYAGRAPDGKVLLRTFVGGAQQSDLVSRDDDSLKQLVLQELTELLGIVGPPTFSHVTRQHRAMPQYQVGHVPLVEKIQARAERLSNLTLAGNALQGIGVPNCIQAGELAAERLLAKMLHNSPLIA